jgi:hypothetical protein
MKMSSDLTKPTWMTRWRLARWRLFQTGKLSVREVYYNHENYDQDHDLMTFSYLDHIFTAIGSDPSSGA